MKLEIGKLYKLHFDRILSNNSGSQSYARAGSICLLLDFNPRKNNNLGYNKFKVLTEDGIIGWTETGLKPEILFTTSIE
jgi:hypothetical protein